MTSVYSSEHLCVSWQNILVNWNHLCVQIWAFMHFPSKYIFIEIATNPSPKRGLLNLGFVHFWTFMHFPIKFFLVNWAPTLHAGGKILRIPGRVSLQLHFKGKVGLVFWKLPVEDFYRYLRQQHATQGIFCSSVTEPEVYAYDNICHH